jgi:hypothetical protein
MDPFAPDGTWQAEWPPEVWLVKWRLQAIGIRPKRKAVLDAITEAARQLYVKRYGYEPVRRDRRRDHYTIVFEHDRVEVIDEAALMVLWHPYERKETQP